ncbi:MAG TPA: patatin-like phospholipase family protein [Gammaproteobacteria bacterium]|nr:patatin-like phospholipase family protein [Gammaproteobacteria bacterium]
MTEANSTGTKTGLLLAGGGARAAYQVGVLRAISAILPRQAANPFPIISGTSAGAINGAALAIYAAHFHSAVAKLVAVWEHFHCHHVFRTDLPGIMSSGSRWLAAMMFGGFGRRNPHALLDRAPLRQLLQRNLRFERIQSAIDAGHLHALAITCSGYTSGQSVTFYQGAHEIPPWRRVRRCGCPAQINVEHLLASSAIPFVFEAARIHREYFGDGSMRQIAPISASLHLGADKVLIVGARTEQEQAERLRSEGYPSVAQIAGHVLNSIFLDALEADLERLQRINRTISLIPDQELREGNVRLRPVEVLVISPSQELDDIALRHAHRLPRSIAFLLKGIGGLRRNGSNLLSYLLFEREYCQELIALGYHDAMAQKEKILAFLEVEPALELRARTAGENGRRM